MHFTYQDIIKLIWSLAGLEIREMLHQMDNTWHITLYHYWFNNKLNLNAEVMKNQVHPMVQWLVAPLLSEKLEVPSGLFGSHHSELGSGLDCITATP